MDLICNVSDCFLIVDYLPVLLRYTLSALFALMFLPSALAYVLSSMLLFSFQCVHSFPSILPSVPRHRKAPLLIVLDRRRPAAVGLQTVSANRALSPRVATTVVRKGPSDGTCLVMYLVYLRMHAPVQIDGLGEVL